MREVLFCAAECKYTCILDAVNKAGWRIIYPHKGQGKHAFDNSRHDLCNVYWIDVANIAERMSKMRPWQRINHFPGMSNIARKNRLAQNLEKMRREFPKEYSFYPRTWVLPLELGDFRSQFDSAGRSSRFYIIKPDSGCQGRGIFLTQTFDSISPLEHVVAQHYIRKPLLIDGFKFDLRLYVLVASCKPLRLYLFQDGLVRLCTEEYLKPSAENVSMRCMHLTNYAINKRNENFQSNENVDQGEIGSKRSLRWFMEYIANEKGRAKADTLWRRMGHVCVKVITSILPTLVREYESTFFKNTGGRDRDAAQEQCSTSEAHSQVEGSRCFEILGVDVIIDHALKPWLVEVNHLPSFATDSPLDLDVKSRLIEQTLSVVKAKSNDRHVYEQVQRGKAEKRLYESPLTGTADDVPLATLTRQRVATMFRLHAPDKLSKLNGLLCKYAGREDKLLRLIEKKYGGNSRVLGQAPPASDYGPNDGEVEDTGDFSALPVQPDQFTTDSDMKMEEQGLRDFERIYPVPREAKTQNHFIPDYQALIEYAFAQDEKRIKRLSCPLRQNRGSVDFADALPPLNEFDRSLEGRGSGSYRHGRRRRMMGNQMRKPLPVPGQKQVAAADRLTRGFSSRQHASAQNLLNATVEGNHPGGHRSDFAKKVANTIAHAREWRRKMDDIWNRRNHGHVALQPKAFIFAQDLSAPACIASGHQKTVNTNLDML